MSSDLHADLHDPHLFDENKAGVYEYGESSTGGKYAEGSLKLEENPTRDASAQKNAGNDLRRGGEHDWGADDGGHLIGARFGGETGEENLTAQNRNLNRGAYKRVENDWAAHLENGDKVYVHMETDSAERPNAYMGYAIYEAEDGTRTYETYHFVNEGKTSVAQWEEDAAQFEREHPEEFADMHTSETSYGDVDYVDLPEEAGEDHMSASAAETIDYVDLPEVSEEGDMSYSSGAEVEQSASME